VSSWFFPVQLSGLNIAIFSAIVDNFSKCSHLSFFSMTVARSLSNSFSNCSHLSFFPVKLRRFLSNSQALEDVEAGLGFQINAFSL
jgi:hypothetical protein